MKKGDKGPPVDSLLKQARTLRDPYYTALALMTLSTDRRLPLDRATETAELALEYAKREKRGWRAAELLGELARILLDWRHGLDKDKKKNIDQLYGNLVNIVRTLPRGKARSVAINGIAGKIPWDQTLKFMSLALDAGGDAPGEDGLVESEMEEQSDVIDTVVEDGRSLIKGWARSLGGAPTSPDMRNQAISDIRSMIMGVDVPEHRSKLLGYLHLQLEKEKLDLGHEGIFISAVRSADGITDEKTRVEMLRYLSTIIANIEQLLELKLRAQAFKDPSHAIRLLATLAGKAHKLGAKELTGEWLKEAEVMLGSGKATSDRMKMMLNLVQGFSKASFNMEAERLLERIGKEIDTMEGGSMKKTMLTRLDHDRKKLGSMNKFQKTMSGKRTTSKPGLREIRGTDGAEGLHIVTGSQPNSSRSRHVLVLYDAYTGGLKPTHIRALARAAPLCIAYDLDLGLMGFPIESAESIVERTIRETNVGQGGALLGQLLAQGRLKLIGEKGESGLEALRQLGIPVATTSHPANEKSVDLERWYRKKEISDRVSDGKTMAKENDKKHLCLIMGLGRQGLPTSMLKELPYHLELTGKKIPLETCTVMGLIAQRLHDLSSHDDATTDRF